MYEFEDITDNVFEQDGMYGRWYSVVHNMQVYRIRMDCAGYSLFNDNMQYINDDDELKDEIEREYRKWRNI